jgi:outer membrane protein OmpA-like peptidoglycan-associated protein
MTAGFDPTFRTFDEFKKKSAGRIRRPEPATPPEPDLPPETAPEPGKKEKRAVLRNPKWETDKVGFNEETDVSVEVELSPEVAHKKKVTFELFAKTPQGPERISQAEGMEKDGKAFCKIPVYIPNYKDEDGNRMPKVEYYFLARHSEADPLDGSNAPKVVDEMADRLIESHILPDITFATGSSFLHPDHASELKAMRANIKEWKKKTPDGKLAIFGHADAVGKESDNKALSERRGRALLAFLTLDVDGYAALAKEEKWGLNLHQVLLKNAGFDPGSNDGQDGPKTQAAVKAFQKKKGLPETGKLEDDARKVLYQDFFDGCNGEAVPAKDFDDVNGNPFGGCSEFNLAEKTQGACGKNRRVGVFLLKSNKNFPINYPCAKGDIGMCKKQVARKGERRTAGFGCFFYDQLIQERPNKQPEILEPIADLKWDKESGWCGDTVKLTAGSNLADGTEVEIKVATEDQVCEELKAKIQGGKLELPWKIRNVAFAFDENKKAKPEVEIYTQISVQGKTFDTKKNLKVKKLVEANAETFDKHYTWGQYGVHAKFTQEIQGDTQKVMVKKKVMKTWGGTYVKLTKAGITDAGGNFPWAGHRWARCKGKSMWPSEYWDGKAWKAIPESAALDGADFGTLPLVKTGDKVHWVGSVSAVWPDAVTDYKWEDYQAKRDAWIKDSDKRWTGVHRIKRKECASPEDKACCAYEIKIEFGMEKVESYENDVICLSPGYLRSNAGLLFYGDSRLAMCAHEVGHLVGQPDEYDKGAVDPNVNEDGAKNGLDSTTLMGGDLSDPNNQIKKRHYSNFAAMAKVLAKNNGGKEEEWIVQPKKTGK